MTYTVITPPTIEPVTLQELKDHLRLNDNSEDAALNGYIKTAREFFEAYTRRFLMAQTIRQYIHELGYSTYLYGGKVNAINSVKYWDTANVLQTLSTNAYSTDIESIPASIWVMSVPVVSVTKRPPAYVEYTAGYATANEVPAMIKTAIKLLAAHYYEQRNSHIENTLDELPMGFKAVCDQFKTGVMGDWGTA